MKDCNGDYFVDGTYFFKKQMGDIPASVPYSPKEKKLKDMLEGNDKLYELHKPFRVLKKLCEGISIENGYKPMIKRVV